VGVSGPTSLAGFQHASVRGDGALGSCAAREASAPVAREVVDDGQRSRGGDDAPVVQLDLLSCVQCAGRECASLVDMGHSRTAGLRHMGAVTRVRMSLQHVQEAGLASGTQMNAHLRIGPVVVRLDVVSGAVHGS
jgi:hypothetical protein